VLTILSAVVAAPVVRAWDAEGHRIVSALAIDLLPSSLPAFFRDPRVRESVLFLSNEADRWRGTTTHPIGHENKPDHYIDLDLLGEFSLAPATLPPFRYDYVEAMAIAKHEHPEKVSPYDASKDRDKSLEWPGFLPHAIVEQYAKLEASLRTLRILEAVGDAATPAEIEAARWNAIVHMGHLSHFVGDAAQPLHTTKHFNGWAGPNPNGYTTDRKFHSLVDGGLIERHGITADVVRGRVRAERTIEPTSPFPAVMEHIGRAFVEVEPLYRLEKSGELAKDAGRELIANRLADAAGFLSSLYLSAWNASAPSDEQIRNFLRFDGRGGAAEAKPAEPGPKSGTEIRKENE
jgi:hypothetical protein